MENLTDTIITEEETSQLKHEETLRHVLKILQAPIKLEKLQLELKKNIAKFSRTEGKGDIFTGLGTIDSIDEIKNEIIITKNLIQRTKDIHEFFNRF